jgi:hypothetical protein
MTHIAYEICKRYEFSILIGIHSSIYSLHSSQEIMSIEQIQIIRRLHFDINRLISEI